MSEVSLFALYRRSCSSRMESIFTSLAESCSSLAFPARAERNMAANSSDGHFCRDFQPFEFYVVPRTPRAADLGARVDDFTWVGGPQLQKTLYRGTAFIRNDPLLGPYSRTV